MTEPTAEQALVALHRVAAAGGFLAYGFMVATMALGLFVALGVGGPVVRRATLVGAHRTLSTMALSFAAIHGLANTVDPSAGLGVARAIVPFLDWRAPAVGAGVVSVELSAAVALSVLARRRLSVRTWQRLHRGGYVAFALAAVHVVAAGRDVRRPLVAVSVLATAAAIVVLLVVRLAAAHRHTHRSSPRFRPTVDGRRADSGLVDSGLVAGGLVQRGLVERGLVDSGLVAGGLVDRRLALRPASIGAAPPAGVQAEANSSPSAARLFEHVVGAGRAPVRRVGEGELT